MLRTRIRRVSKKRVAVLRQERKLVQELLKRCHGLCEECNKPPDFRGLRKHEIKMRSHGGDPTDPANCLMVCGRCHSKFHGIEECQD